MAVVIVASLVGCGERPVAVGVVAPVPAPVADVGAIADVPATPSPAKVWFDPAEMEDCALPRVGTIHWDASKSGAEQIDVKIVTVDGSENLFATDGPVGSQITQPWLRAGLLVILRDHASGAELGRKTMAARPCTR